MNDSHVTATRYLFLRSVRKLQNRFNQALWQDSDKLSKIAAITSELDEYMEELDIEHELPDIKDVEKDAQKIVELCEKLEGDFLYDSIPILQIRNLSTWAHIGAASGTKVIIIEKAERMLEGVRNALLKILEEPPANTMFILTTSRRNAVMPTILSRLRNYSFSTRTAEQEKERTNVLTDFYLTLKSFVSRPHVITALCFILLYRLPEGLLTKIVPLFLTRTTAEGGLALSDVDFGLIYGTQTMATHSAGLPD
jgi:hypothetical protein